MTQRAIGLACRKAALCCCLILAMIVSAGLATPPLAQTDPAPQEADPRAEGTAGNDTDIAVVEDAPTGPDYADWAETAARTEMIAENRRASAFALERLRADLVIWRDAFSAAQESNLSRIATVQGQLAALGEPPAEGAAPEDARVIARREALMTQLARLRAPVALATEAHAHADGLIGEIDTLIRARQTSQLMTRGVSPLAPAVWPEVGTALSTRAVGLSKELRTSLTSTVRLQTFRQSWPTVLLYLALGAVLFARGGRWLAQLDGTLSTRTLRGRGVWRFVLSVGTVVVPWLGLIAITRALDASGMFGFRATQLIDAVPQAGLLALSAHWLAAQFMPARQTNPVPFDFSEDRKAVGRRLIVQAGWVLALSALWEAFLSTGDVGAVVRSVGDLPFDFLLAFVVFGLGRVLAHAVPPTDPPEPDAVLFRRRIVVLFGRLAMGAALAAPVLAITGYGAAAAALLDPALLTLCLLALVVRLQWLTHDIHALITRSDDGARDALLPVLMGFVLLMLALPVLALIWGARVEDLWEVWTRFREGFSFGETRISPTDFLTFVLVFGIGFALTRLVQGTLRTTVLPKTKLDIGGQNALVSGMGYVGVFLAAIIAISSAGLDLSNLAIVAGALSVGIGFGLQNIVSNFVSGIILLIERPISEGDWIEVGGKMGYVRDISVRSTRIETFDRTDVIVPNADLVSGQVINWTRGNSVGRVIVPVGVAYGTDTHKVAAILREIAEGHPMVLLTPPPAVVFMGFGADALNFEIRAVIRDVNFGLSVRSEMNHSIAGAFAEAGIVMPFAQREVWLHNADATPPPVAVPPKMPAEWEGDAPQDSPPPEAAQ